MEGWATGQTGLRFCDACRSLLGDAGLHLVDSEGKADGMDARDLQQVLSDKMEMNMDAAVSFIVGLRLYLADDAFKVTP